MDKEIENIENDSPEKKLSERKIVLDPLPKFDLTTVSAENIEK
jgi:hypothetical protein